MPRSLVVIDGLARALCPALVRVGGGLQKGRRRLVVRCMLRVRGESSQRFFY